jgi:thiamine pyrophosphokinase
MKAKSKYILFLNNIYASRDNDFYLHLLGGKVRVAVDGGVRFFLRNNIYPDILVGDFDSAPPLSKKYLSNFEVIIHPSEKDKTDCHLAVDLALARGAEEIEICGAIGTREIDHILGNIMLLDLVNRFNTKSKRRVSARIVKPAETLYLVDDTSLDLRSAKGDYISIIPLSNDVRLDYDNLLYPPPKGKLNFGDTLTLRNVFGSRRCRLAVVGKAIVVIVSRQQTRTK